jgi:hypothetical protein
MNMMSHVLGTTEHERWWQQLTMHAHWEVVNSSMSGAHSSSTMAGNYKDKDCTHYKAAAGSSSSRSLRPCQWQKVGADAGPTGSICCSPQR